jgi:hypothetical protein
MLARRNQQEQTAAHHLLMRMCAGIIHAIYVLFKR